MVNFEELRVGPETVSSLIGDDVDDDAVDLKPGSYAGRYMILDMIGRGGMGAVYKAYDPDLDRRIALKVLRVRGRTDEVASRARERLLREAQALAQLSHPNVVAAYDVGTIGLDVFVAMELVEGRTMREWLREARPTQRQVIAAMVDAGRGIAAAHKAGLIHRDIKPDNIIVGKDGRVCVLDFGLARALSFKEWAGEARERELGQIVRREISGSDSGSLSASSGERTTGHSSETAQEMISLDTHLKIPLTMAGSVMGTPGYMAPEQYIGEDVNEATDQFCFCVTLYEVLYGVRPFAGDSFKQLKHDVTSGNIRPTPPNVKVPAWVRRIIARGLMVAREDRYLAMDALLTDLSRDPARLWRRIGLGAAVAVLVVASFVGAAWWQTRMQRMCQGAEALLNGVWDDPLQTRVRQAFAQTGRAHAADTFRRVSTVLGERSVAWVRMRQEACEATRVRGEQSEHLLDLRIRCLDRRLSEMRALVDLFAAQPDGDVADRAVQAAYELPGLERCSDAEALQAAVPPPDDPAVRATVEELRRGIDEVRALETAGKYQEGQRVASAVSEEAVRTHYLPLQAEAQTRLGWIKARTGDFKGAEESLFLATQEAAESRDDQLFAEAALSLVYVLGTQQARFAEALSLSKLVDAVVARSGNSPKLRADSLTNAGYVLLRQGEFAEAQKKLEQALLLSEKALGREHPKVGHVMNQLANVFLEQGKTDEAKKLLDRALEIWQKAFGPNHPSTAIALNNLAQVQLQQGHYAEAQAAYERVLSIWQATLGPEHPKVAIPLHNLGEVMAEQNRCEEAMAYYQRALPIYQKAYGPTHTNLGPTLTGMGECLTRLGRTLEAIPLLEQALKIREQNPGEKATLAKTRFGLARALWEAPERRATAALPLGVKFVGRDRRRALELAGEARAAYQEAGQAREEAFREVDAWLQAVAAEDADRR